MIGAEGLPSHLLRRSCARHNQMPSPWTLERPYLLKALDAHAGVRSRAGVP